MLIAAVALYLGGSGSGGGTAAVATPDPAAPGATATTGVGAKLPDVDTMITRLAKRLEAKPDDPEGWRMLGWSYFGTQHYPEAVKAYAKAVEQRPGDASFQSAYGEAITKAANDRVTPEAVDAFRKALAINAKDDRARVYMARLKHQNGDSKGALNDLFAILNAAAPDSVGAVSAREAIRKVSADSGVSVADRLPPEPSAQAAPAMSAAPSGVPGPTAADVQAAQKMAPSDQQAMVEGMINRLEGRLATSPKDADGWIMLIRSRKQMGQDDKAHAALTHGLAAFVGDEPSRARISAAARSFGVE